VPKRHCTGHAPPKLHVHARLHAARSRAGLPARTVPSAPAGALRQGRPPPKRQRAGRTARSAVPCPASGLHGTVRAGRCSAPGPRPAQTAPCAPDRMLRGSGPGSQTARRRARRAAAGSRVFGTRAAPRPNGTVPRAGPHAERSRARIPELTVPCAPVGVRRPGRAPPKRHRARRTACCKVLCPAPGPHGAVRAGRSSAPGLAPAQTALCAPDRMLCCPEPGSRSARRLARRQVYGARAPPRPNGTVRAGPHAVRSRARLP
jgi:hypothetical protein